MFRTVGDQPSLFESVLPPELLRLPVELARVDTLLDDPAFFAPFVPFFDPRMGRPSTPMETYLRLMFLKFRYRLGYESLCREVSDSITWRRFCRIPLEGSVPHPTTLMKLTTRCGSAAVQGLNEALLAKAADAKLLRTTGCGPTPRWCRATCPTRPTRVCWPGRSAGSRSPAGGSRPPVARPGPGSETGPGRPGSGPIRSARSCGRAPPAGKDEAQAAVRRLNGELADLAETAANDAERLLANAKRALRRARAKAESMAACGVHDPVSGRRRGRLARAVDDLTELVAATRQIAAQTRQRMSGLTPKGRPAGSACTTPMPARSPRDGSASPWSSATRLSWSTTSTA